MTSIKNCSFIFVLFFAILETSLANAQSQSQPSVEDKTNWRQIPAPIHAHGDTSGSLKARQLRDAYWDRTTPHPTNGISVTSPTSSYLLSRQDIVPLPDTFWAVGKAIGHDVYETANGTLYTEIHLRIEHLIGQIPGSAPQVGSVVDIGIPGGSIIEADGTIKEARTSNFQDYVRPNHRYIIELLPSEQGGFFLEADLWDVTSGFARPVLPMDKARAARGMSKVSGLNETNAIALIQQSLEGR